MNCDARKLDMQAASAHSEFEVAAADLLVHAVVEDANCHNLNTQQRSKPVVKQCASMQKNDSQGNRKLQRATRLLASNAFSVHASLPAALWPRQLVTLRFDDHLQTAFVCCCELPSLRRTCNRFFSPLADAESLFVSAFTSALSSALPALLLLALLPLLLPKSELRMPGFLAGLPEGLAGFFLGAASLLCICPAQSAAVRYMNTIMSGNAQ